MSYKFKQVTEKIEEETKQCHAFNHSDNIANEGKREALRWLKEFTEEIDSDLKSAFGKDVPWELHDIQMSKALAIYLGQSWKQGAELWRINVGSLKIGVFQSPHPPGDPGFVIAEVLEKRAKLLYDQSVLLNEACKIVDRCSEIYGLMRS